MFGSRDLFLKSEQINEAANRILKKNVDKLAPVIAAQASSFTAQSLSEDNNIRIQATKIVEEILEDSQVFYLKRLYQQAKQLSQIIAYIWRNAEEDENLSARQLRNYFLVPSEIIEESSGRIEPGGNLKKLLAANPREDNNEGEADLLRQVFPDYESNKKLIFPIFSQFELGDTEFKNLGYSLEVNVNDFFGVLEDVNVNNPSLFKFVIPYPPRPQLGEATVTSSMLDEWIDNREENQYFADNPYIPTTCC